MHLYSQKLKLQSTHGETPTTSLPCFAFKTKAPLKFKVAFSSMFFRDSDEVTTRIPRCSPTKHAVWKCLNFAPKPVNITPVDLHETLKNFGDKRSSLRLQCCKIETFWLTFKLCVLLSRLCESSSSSRTATGPLPLPCKPRGEEFWACV